MFSRFFTEETVKIHEIKIFIGYIQVIAGSHINHRIILITSKKANLGALLTLSMCQLSVLNYAMALFSFILSLFPLCIM